MAFPERPPLLLLDVTALLLDAVELSWSESNVGLGIISKPALLPSRPSRNLSGKNISASCISWISVGATLEERPGFTMRRAGVTKKKQA
jgi:hypothetical protein